MLFSSFPINVLSRKAAKPQSLFFHFLGDLASLRERAIVITALILFSFLPINVLYAQGYLAESENSKVKVSLLFDIQAYAFDLKRCFA